MKRRLTLAASALFTALCMAPNALAEAVPVQMQPSSIVLNGQTVYTPYRFVAHNTTYIPIWYVMQALKKLGVTSVWNGVHELWTLSASGYNGTLHLTAAGGVTAIAINGAVVEQKVPTLVARDPQSHVNTTYMPIWYVQQVLNHIGVKTDVWNGTKGTWTLGTLVTQAEAGQGGSGPSSSTGVNVNTDFPNAATIARYGGGVNPAPAGATLAQWQLAGKDAVKAIKTAPFYAYSPLATATQWYPDPTDIFYDKVFPVKDLTNGRILQQDPLVEVTTIDGTNALTDPYVYVDEYVGWGINLTDSAVTYWKEEQVTLHAYTTTMDGYTHSFPAGAVTAVIPGAIGLPYGPSKIGGFPLMKPQANQGYNFGKVQPQNLFWVTGAGLYVVPIPGWNPLSISQYKQNLKNIP